MNLILDANSNPIEPLAIIACGGRNFTDRAFVYRTLNRVYAKRPIAKVIVGSKRGADGLARLWAIGRAIECEVVEADWDALGRPAGPIHNGKMIELLLALPMRHGVVAFPGGRGTADMVLVALEAGVNVYEPGSKESR